MGDEWEHDDVQSASQPSTFGLTAVVRMYWPLDLIYCFFLICLYLESAFCKIEYIYNSTVSIVVMYTYSGSHLMTIFTALCYTEHGYGTVYCPSVCLSVCL